MKFLLAILLLVLAAALPDLAEAAAGIPISIKVLDDLGASVIAYTKFGLVLVGGVLIVLASLDSVKQRSEGVGKYLKGLGFAAVGMSAFLFLYDYSNDPANQGAVGGANSVGQQVNQYKPAGF